MCRIRTDVSLRGWFLGLFVEMSYGVIEHDGLLALEFEGFSELGFVLNGGFGASSEVDAGAEDGDILRDNTGVDCRPGLIGVGN